MALTVGGQKFQKRDSRLSSYQRINRRRSSYKESNLGKRTGGETIYEKVSEPSASTLKEANTQAASSSQPEPIASAVEGGVIFSDEFRGTPIATASSGGTIYIKNQALPTNYERGNNFGSGDGTFSANNRFGDGSSVDSKKTISQKYEQRESEIQQTIERLTPLKKEGNVAQQIGYAGATVIPSGINLLRGTLEAGAYLGKEYLKGSERRKEIREEFVEVGLPALKEAPIQTAESVSVLKRSGEFNPSGLVNIALIAGAFKKPSTTTATSEKPSSTSSRSSSFSVESAAGRALRTGTATDIDAAIGRLSRDVYRRVDVTSPSRIENILPTTNKAIPKKFQTSDFNLRTSVKATTRSPVRFGEFSGGENFVTTQPPPLVKPKTPFTAQEALDFSTPELKLTASFNLNKKFVGNKPIIKANKAAIIESRQFDLLKATEEGKIDFGKLFPGKQTKSKFRLEDNVRLRKELQGLENLGQDKRYAIEYPFVEVTREKITRPRFIDEGQGKKIVGKQTFWEIKRERDFSRPVVYEKKTGKLLTPKQFNSYIEGQRVREARKDFSRGKRDFDEQVSKFFEREQKREGFYSDVKRLDSRAKKYGNVFGNKKGQAQLFRQETVVLEKPSYGRSPRAPRLRTRSADEFYGRRPRQAAYPEFPQRESSLLANELESSSATKYVNKARFKVPYLGLLGEEQKSDISSLTGNAQRSSFRTYQETTPGVLQDTKTSQGQFSFRSLSRGLQKASQATALVGTAGALALTTLPKPGKNPINRFFRGGESGGGGNSGGQYNNKYGSKKSYVPSFVGVERGIKATKQQRRAAGTRGYGLSGLEVRGI